MNALPMPTAGQIAESFQKVVGMQKPYVPNRKERRAMQAIARKIKVVRK